MLLEITLQLAPCVGLLDYYALSGAPSSENYMNRQPLEKDLKPGPPLTAGYVPDEALLGSEVKLRPSLLGF
jgi:hypothetical protein